MSFFSGDKGTLCKYLSLTEDGGVRCSIFENGLFRATQPKNLNDVLSESKVIGYFNKFSPMDKELVRVNLKRDNQLPDYEPSQKAIEMALKPASLRMTTERFPGLKGFTGGKETSEFEEKVLGLNKMLVELLSQLFGVLSLSQNCLDELMWSHYASEGRSICVEFDKSHEYFAFKRAEKVSYADENRLQFSYYEGVMRFHGVKVLKDDNQNSLQERLLKVFYEDIGLESVVNSVLFAKSPRWNNEGERRVLYKLEDCDLVKESKNTDGNLEIGTSVYCAKVPFSAFKSVFLGYNISDDERVNVLSAIAANSELSHVKIYDVKPSAWDKLKLEPIDF